MSGPKRLAVLGGGMSSLVTVFELTSQPNWRERWSDIAIYQVGWRLGGKGASTRSATSGRIEEHGLHLLFGGYENTFRALGRCFSELETSLPPSDTTWRRVEHAFTAQQRVVMFETRDDGWSPWELTGSLRPDEFPGRGDARPFSPWTLLRLLLELGSEWFEDALGRTRAASEEFRQRAQQGLDALAAGRSIDDPLELLAVARAIAAREDEQANGSPIVLSLRWPVRLPDSVRTLISLARRALAMLRRVGAARLVRRAALGAEFHLTVVIGVLTDDVIAWQPTRGWVEDWTVIDRWDLRAWLRRHGASDSVADSAPVAGLYAAAFSAGHTVAAGSILHGYARMLHYKGAPIYRMSAGMGETIFAPLYRVLRNRGVRFEFFHRVEELVLSAGRDRVEAVRMTRQVRLRDPRQVYEPLVPTPSGLPCWPPGPILAQIHEGDASTLADRNLEDWWEDFQDLGRTRILQADAASDDGFDMLVLGIGVGALPFICDALVEDTGNPAFRRMVNGVVTRPTRAAQLWVEKDFGWRGAQPVVIPFAAPFDTWADMTPLLAVEGAPASVRGLAYLCMGMDDQEPPPRGVDPGYTQSLGERVRGDLEQWLREHAPALWPGLRTPDSAFDWNTLHDPGRATGVARLDAQYWHAPLNPSDRYVLSVAGSTELRLAADESGYSNLFLTGDWTRCDLNLGCLEAATTAGIRTARALDPRVPEPVYPSLPPRRQRSARIRTAAVAPRPYVVRDGEMLAPPPIALNVDPLFTFIVPADMGTLERLCDRELNLDSSRSYRPAGAFVVFYCSRLDNAVPGGSVPEIDFGVWVPVLSRSGASEKLHAYSPYVWVDSSPAMLGGRAVFGFAKHVAKLSLPEVGNPARFSADAWYLPRHGGVAREGRLLEIERPGNWDGTLSRWPDLESIERGIDEIAAKTIPWRLLLHELLAPRDGLPMVFLKQFPVADGSSNACYQAILEGPISLTGHREGGLLPGNWRVRLRRCASHDLCGTLGLSPRRIRDQNSAWDVLDVRLAGWMRFLAEVEPAQVVWQAP